MPPSIDQASLAAGLGIAGTGVLYARQPKTDLLHYGRRQ
jgi:hypothetical protein